MTRTDTAAAPYRAEASRGDGQWHLTVQSLDTHLERGQVDALVVTVTPRRAGDGFPAADLDRALRQSGFTRDGEWSPDGDARTAPCRHPRPHAAPPPRE